MRDAPNTGANDGANLLSLTPASYRDFRPSVQLASAMFEDARAYPPAAADDMLLWLDLPLPQDRLEPPGSRTFEDGGYAVLRVADAMAMVRFPRFRFRPSQADALHLDFWLGADNVLRDGGTYSYNQGVEWIDYFGGVQSHNSAQFDDAPQMPRLGRFLLGDWLTTRDLEPVTRHGGGVAFAAAYRAGEREHHRRVELGPESLTVRDRLSGFRERAVLRWRLAPGAWRMTETGVADGSRTLSVAASVPIVGLRLVTGHESRHYFELTELPVLEAEIAEPGEITTELRWS